MVQLHLVPIKSFSSAGLLIPPSPLSPRDMHTDTCSVLGRSLSLHIQTNCTHLPSQPVITAALARITKQRHCVYSTSHQTCAAAPHPGVIYRYPFVDSNKRNPVSSRRNRIKSNSYSHNTSYSAVPLLIVRDSLIGLQSMSAEGLVVNYPPARHEIALKVI